MQSADWQDYEKAMHKALRLRGEDLTYLRVLMIIQLSAF